MTQWKCTHCGETNDADVDFCFGCGTYLDDAPASAPREKNKLPTDLGESVTDPLFGEIFWNQKDKKWVGVYPPGAASPFALTIDAPLGKDAPLPESLRTSMQNVSRMLPEIPYRAAKDLMEDYVDWHEDEGPISEEEFVKRLSPGGISIEKDGTAEIWFNDDQEALFGGHWLVTTINPDGTIEKFGLEG